MSTKNDGGPAYPSRHPGVGDPSSVGMSLRDWFVGNSLNKTCGIVTDSSDAKIVAVRAYMLADAMLAERNKQ